MTETNKVQPHTTAVLYTRVSSAVQTLGTSLDTQREDLERYAKSLGYENTLVFEDAGMSGADSSRPALEDAVQTVERGEADVLLVWDLTRLGRAIGHTLETRERIHAAGGKILDRKGQSSEGSLMFTILGAIAEYERDQIRERTMGGLLARAKQGRWLGGAAPFGTQSVSAPDGQGNVLVEDRTQADAIRLVTRLLVDERMTTGQAAEQLNRQSIRSMRGDRWTHRNLKRLLLSRRLFGDYRWGEAEHQLTHPEIISKQQWDDLQRALARTSRGSPDRAVYPLSTRIKCPCGGVFVGAGKANGVRQYRCQNNIKSLGTERCSFTKVRFISAHRIEEPVWAAVCNTLMDPSALLESAGRALQTRSVEEDSHRSELGQARARVTELKKERTRIGVKYMRSDIPDDIIKSAVGAVQSDLEAALQRQDQLVLLVAAHDADSAYMEHLRKIAGRAQSLQHETDLESRKRWFDDLNITVTIEGRAKYSISGDIYLKDTPTYLT